MTGKLCRCCSTDLEKTVEALGGFLWLGNNLHNSHTETFKEFYGHAMVDARPIYEALVAALEKEKA